MIEKNDNSDWEKCDCRLLVLTNKYNWYKSPSLGFWSLFGCKLPHYTSYMLNYTHIDTHVTNPTLDAEQERVTWHEVLRRHKVIPREPWPSFDTPAAYSFSSRTPFIKSGKAAWTVLYLINTDVIVRRKRKILYVFSVLFLCTMSALTVFVTKRFTKTLSDED